MMMMIVVVLLVVVVDNHLIIVELVECDFDAKFTKCHDRRENY